jgi:hypothetical protein
LLLVNTAWTRLKCSCGHLDLLQHPNLQAYVDCSENAE